MYHKSLFIRSQEKLCGAIRFFFIGWNRNVVVLQKGFVSDHNIKRAICCFIKQLCSYSFLLNFGLLKENKAIISANNLTLFKGNFIQNFSKWMSNLFLHYRDDLPIFILLEGFG